MNLGQKNIYIYFYIVTWHALKDLFFESSLNNKKPFISASDGLRLKKNTITKCLELSCLPQNLLGSNSKTLWIQFQDLKDLLPPLGRHCYCNLRL